MTDEIEDEEDKPAIGTSTGKKDYYEEGNDPKFTPPCDTCVHRNKGLQDFDCPCLKCIHYF